LAHPQLSLEFELDAGIAWFSGCGERFRSAEESEEVEASNTLPTAATSPIPPRKATTAHRGLSEGSFSIAYPLYTGKMRPLHS